MDQPAPFSYQQNQAPSYGGAVPAFGLSQEFVTHQPVTLMLEERSRRYKFGGPDGQALFGLDCSSAFTRHQQLNNLRTGQPLLVLASHAMSVKGSYHIDSPSGQRLVDMDGKFAFMKQKYDLKFHTGMTQGVQRLDVNGRIGRGSGSELTCNGRSIATVRRQSNGWGFSRTTMWEVNMAPGVDMAFMATVITALILQTRKNQAASGASAGAAVAAT